MCRAVLPLLSRLEPSRVPSVVVAPHSSSSCIELGHCRRAVIWRAVIPASGGKEERLSLSFVCVSKIGNHVLRHESLASWDMQFEI